MAKLILSFVISVGCAYILYPQFRPFKFFVLRAISVFLLAAFILNLGLQFSVSRKRRLDFYVDLSGSMETDFKARWRDEQVKSLESHGLKFKFFARNLLDKNNLDTTETLSTDLSVPIADADKDGIVIITDGIHNAPSDPYMSAQQRSIPVYFVLPRIKLPPNIHIKSISTPRIVKQGELARVIANVELTGMDSAVAQAVLKTGDSTLVETTLSLHNGENRFEFWLPANRSGVQKYSLEIQPLMNESAVTDNEQEFGLVVAKAALKGVIIATHPTPEIRLLRATISQMMNTDVDVFVLLDRKNWTLAAGNIVRKVQPSIKDADFLILIDPTKSVKGLTKGYEPNRMIVFYGRNSVKDGLVQNFSGNFNVVPTKRFFDVVMDSFPDDLPPLSVIYKPGDMQPIEEILKVSLKRGAKSGSRPLLARLQDGSFAVLSSEFWVLGLAHRDLYDSVMAYVIRSASLGRGIFIAGVDKPVSYLGQELNFYADAFNDVGEPLEDLSVQLIIDTTDTFTMVPTEAGRFEYTKLQLDAGQHVAKITFRTDTSIVAERNIDLTVKSIPLEYLQAGVDSVLPRAVAEMSGGGIFPSVDSLLKAWDELKFKTVKELRFNRSPIIMLLALAILALEWWLRKSNGLL